MSINKRCHFLSRLLFTSLVLTATVVESSPCNNNQASCGTNGPCIKKEALCDNTQDCYDFTDEKNCPHITCKSDEFKCHAGMPHCIDTELKCDGYDSCKDGSDESLDTCNDGNKLCTNIDEIHIKCADGLKCVLKSQWCDGDKQCWDGSDEYPGTCKKYTCSQGYTKCDNRVQCVALTSWCDGGERHCNDGSDERKCDKPVGASCRVNTECVNNIKCHNRKCGIQSSYVENNDSSFMSVPIVMMNVLVVVTSLIFTRM